MAKINTAQAIQSGDEPWTNDIRRSKGSNFHQRAHFFITFEDGSKDHWLVLFPQSFTDNDLAEGHSHGGFDIKFSKPVKEFIDVYTCIGCGARDQGYTVLHFGYDSGANDSLDTIHKGLPYEPWFNEFTNARLGDDNYWTCLNGKHLGSRGDVWEFTGQYIRGKDNKPFNEAYGFIPMGGTIQWTTKGGGTKIEWQEKPSNDNFDNLDWSSPVGSGGELEIPLTDPEVSVPEPGENDPTPDLDLPGPDLFDPTGGEPEIPPIEPDITIDEDIPEDDFQDFEPPPIEVEPPEIDPNDQDTTQDQDTGDYDIPAPDPFDLGDDDND
ncbi:MAG: hypothetical protein MRERV_38c019 [Mycoplasmataceae bacterium RV_VA103A]|nr:MAG: hypothetical protein MRERV_38c019 [Mycoplasmataceae bacterium RV_VA103A]